MRALDLGLGAREVLASPAAGRVLAVYSRAAYLRFPAGLLAVTTGRAPAGPLHLRCAGLPLRAGQRVHTDGARLAGDRWSVRLDVPTWVGALPAVGEPTTQRGWPSRNTVARRPPSLPQLRGLAAALGGRGPGLTPAGDDVLAGLLLAARARHGPAAEPGLVAIASAVPTTDVASAFLIWAARGQCIEPAHAVLAALAAGDAQRTAAASARLVDVGASSGRALLTGLRLGVSAPVIEATAEPCLT